MNDFLKKFLLIPLAVIATVGLYAQDSVEDESDDEVEEIVVLVLEQVSSHL